MAKPKGKLVVVIHWYPHAHKPHHLVAFSEAYEDFVLDYGPEAVGKILIGNALRAAWEKRNDYPRAVKKKTTKIK